MDEVIKVVESKKIHKRKLADSDSNEFKQFIKQRNCLVLRKGILYQEVTQTQEDRNNIQLLLTLKYHEIVLKGCHTQLGHLGTENDRLI